MRWGIRPCLPPPLCQQTDASLSYPSEEAVSWPEKPRTNHSSRPGQGHGRAGGGRDGGWGVGPARRGWTQLRNRQRQTRGNALHSTEGGGGELWVMHLAIGCCFCAVLYPCAKRLLCVRNPVGRGPEHHMCVNPHRTRHATSVSQGNWFSVVARVTLDPLSPLHHPSAGEPN